MAFEQRNMNGALFRNDKKEKETHPDYTGSAKVDDIEYYISGWVKTSKGGQKYMSLAFTPKNASPVQAGNVDFDDDILF